VLTVECAEHHPECTVLGKMSGGHYTLNRVTAYGPVAEISASVQNTRFLCSCCRATMLCHDVLQLAQPKSAN